MTEILPIMTPRFQPPEYHTQKSGSSKCKKIPTIPAEIPGRLADNFQVGHDSIWCCIVLADKAVFLSAIALSVLAWSCIPLLFQDEMLSGPACCTFYIEMLCLFNKIYPSVTNWPV